MIDIEALALRAAEPKRLWSFAWQFVNVEVLAALVAEECAKAARGAISAETDWDTSYWNQGVECAAEKARAAFPMPKE